MAILLLMPGLPLIGLLVVLVRLTSRGPGIFRQLRVGQHGRNFVMYKIRTMRLDAEDATGPVWTQTHDLRTTPMGKLLRKCHLDELPQLFNVLKGEMALIGPRPERPEFVHILAETIPGYLNRLAAPPGVTGLAQLNLPPDSDLNSVRRKLVLDCEYIRQAGPWLDIRLFACTGFRMLKLPEGLMLAIFGLRRQVSVSDTLEGVSSSGHGNGNGNGNGSHHAVATPLNVRVQAVFDAAADDIDLSIRREHSAKENLRHASRPKPR